MKNAINCFQGTTRLVQNHSRSLPNDIRPRKGGEAASHRIGFISPFSSARNRIWYSVSSRSSHFGTVMPISRQRRMWSSSKGSTGTWKIVTEPRWKINDFRFPVPVHKIRSSSRQNASTTASLCACQLNWLYLVPKSERNPGFTIWFSAFSAWIIKRLFIATFQSIFGVHMSKLSKILLPFMLLSFLGFFVASSSCHFLSKICKFVFDIN